MPGRVESYIHSDRQTPNKGGSLVCVLCETDFAAKTEEFKEFAQRVAKMAYASSSEEVESFVSWESIVKLYPGMAIAKSDLSCKLREIVTVEAAVIVRIR